MDRLQSSELSIAHGHTIILFTDILGQIIDVLNTSGSIGADTYKQLTADYTSEGISDDFIIDLCS